MDSHQTTIETWNKMASLYQDKFMDLDLYNDTYDMFCGLIEKHHPKILEIGCGPGNITRYISAKRPDFDIEAIDAAPNMIALAKKHNPAAHFKVLDCREIETLRPGFDAIICGFCMPYLSKGESERLIKDCSSLLNSGGILYFSTIEDDYSKSGYEANSAGTDRMFVYYHQADYLQEALRKNNFEQAALIRKDYLKAEGTKQTHLIFIAKKK